MIDLSNSKCSKCKLLVTETSRADPQQDFDNTVPFPDHYFTDSVYWCKPKDTPVQDRGIRVWCILHSGAALFRFIYRKGSYPERNTNKPLQQVLARMKLKLKS